MGDFGMILAIFGVVFVLFVACIVTISDNFKIDQAKKDYCYNKEGRYMFDECSAANLSWCGTVNYTIEITCMKEKGYKNADFS